MAFDITLIDDVAPILGSVGQDSYTNDPSPLAQISLTSTGADIGDLVILDDQDLFGAVGGDQQSYTLTAEDLARGYLQVQLASLVQYWHVLTARLVGPGAVEIAAASSIFSIATDPPTAPSITAALDDVGLVQGPFASGDETDDTTPALRVFIPDRPPVPEGSPGHPSPYAGTAMNFDAQIQLLEDGRPVATTTLAGFYSNFVDITAPLLSPGVHTFTAGAIDRAGNVSAPSAPFSLTIAAPPAVPVVSISATTPTLSEGDSGATAFSFLVARTGDLTAATTVDYAVAGGSGANAQDFVGGLSGQVSFAAGEAERTIVVNVKGDTAVEANEAFTVSLSAPVGGSLGTASAGAVIVNDDLAPAPKGPTGGADIIAATATSHYLIGLAGSDSFLLQKATFGQPGEAPPAWGTYNFIGDFQGAGGWQAANNDTVAITGFSAEASLHMAFQAAGDSHLYYYYVQDGAEKYWFGVLSENGKALTPGADVFLWH